MESENETHDAKEGSFASTGERKTTFYENQKTTVVSDVTIEHHNSQSVNKITELIFG